MANNVIVVDTSVFIKRPIVLEKLIEHFDKIIIPQTVIEELNYLKDHNKNVEQKAWLAMRNISEMKNNKIIIKQGDRSLDNTNNINVKSINSLHQPAFLNKTLLCIIFLTML